MIGVGTLVNTATVALGAGLGLVAARRIPERLRRTITQTLGLVTLFLAATMFIRFADDAGLGYSVHVIAAVLIGAIVGELLRIEQGLERLGEWLRGRFAAKQDGGGAGFVEGFVVASMIFCIGPLTVLGTFQDARGEPPMLLVTKAAMDGVLAIALAAAFGRGVLFSAAFILVFQGLLTAGFAATASGLPELYVSGIRATGGVLVLAIGLLLLDVVRIRVANLLPALPIVCLLLWLWKDGLN